MKRLFFLACLLPILSANAADYVTGQLVKKGNKFFIKSHQEEYRIETSPLIEKSLPSLYEPAFVRQSNKVPYAFEFKGEQSGNVFKLEQVPTNIPGPASLTGILEYDRKHKRFSVGNTQIRFGYTKVLNGYEFDDISKQFLVGKDLLLEGRYEGDIFIAQALTPRGLLAATSAPLEKDPEHLVLEEIPLNKNSQATTSFRRILYEGQGQGVEKGDHALIITMSGRQGDSFGSVNGHFVAGLAEVKEDLTLRGEVSNAYVTNGKDILSGNTSLTNYFSHLVQGQNIYRPTYTLIIYGIDAQKLKQFRDALEASHIEFRTKKLDITAEFNCTTETVKALADAGIEGRYRQLGNTVGGVLASPLRLLGGTPATLQYALANDPSRYHPRAAFNSFFKAFMKDSVQEELGVKRVDFVFYAQIPSARPVGGAALANILKVNKYKKLYEEYEENEATKLSIPELRRKLMEILTPANF